MTKVAVPQYIQECIKRMYRYSDVVKKNTVVVNDWMLRNKVNRKTPLTEFIVEKEKANKEVPENQLTIFDVE